MGPLYFIAAMLMLISFYFRKGNRVLTYAFLGALVFLPLILKPVGTFFAAGMSAPLRAIVAVNQGEDNTYALSVLKYREGPEELFPLPWRRKERGISMRQLQITGRFWKRIPITLWRTITWGIAMP